jgi:calpain, invertebrate
MFSKGVYPPIFHIYRKKGMYIFRFFKNFKWIYVLIDDRLPCNNRELVFGKCRNPRELWVPLIEKAYAKLHGCYESMISGFTDDGLTDLTGFVSEKVLLHNPKTETFPHPSLIDADSFWQYLLDRKNEKSLMGCSRSSENIEGDIIIDGVPTGILGGHAYGIIDVFELENPENEKRPFHRLLAVRNPHGEREWKGDWGDKSPQLEDPTIMNLIQNYINTLPD